MSPPKVIFVVKVGEVPKTNTPDPVSSEIERAALAEEIEVARAPPVVVLTNLSAVRPENVIVPDDVTPVPPVIAPAPVMSSEAEFNILPKVPVIRIPSVMVPAVSAI